MAIDLKGFTAPEGFPVEVLESKELASFINDAHQKQIDAYVSIEKEKYTGATTAKAIADEKVEKLNAELADLRNSGGGNADVEALKAKVASAKKDAELEYQGKFEAIQKERDALEGEKAKLNDQLNDVELTGLARDAIAQYKAANKALPPLNGAEGYLEKEIKAKYRKSETGDFRGFDGDKPLLGQNGHMTAAEYLTAFRDTPEGGIFFQDPIGSGATGGKGGGAGEKTITRSQLNAITDPVKKSETARSHTLIEG